MPNTMELLNKALAVKRAARWCEEMGVDPSAISNARKRGKLSATMAAHMAIGIDEDPMMWAAIASIENDSHNPDIKAKVLARIETVAALYLDASFTGSTGTAKQRGRKTRCNHSLSNRVPNAKHRANRLNSVSTLYE